MALRLYDRLPLNLGVRCPDIAPRDGVRQASVSAGDERSGHRRNFFDRRGSCLDRGLASITASPSFIEKLIRSFAEEADVAGRSNRLKG